MEDWLSYALLCWFSIFFVVASSPNPSTSIFGGKSNTFFRDYEVITYKTCFISVFLLIYTKKNRGHICSTLDFVFDILWNIYRINSNSRYLGSGQI